MYHSGETVKVLFSEVKGDNATHVGETGVVVKVQPLLDLVAIYQVVFGKSKCWYLDRELQKAR